MERMLMSRIKADYFDHCERLGYFFSPDFNNDYLAWSSYESEQEEIELVSYELEGAYDE